MLHTNKGYESNSEMDMSTRFVPIVVLTKEDDDTNFLFSDIPLKLPASATVSSDTSALVTFSQTEGNLVRNVPSLHPIPSQTRVNPWQLQYPSAYPQCVRAVLGPQETVQLVTQRAREALNDQRETARRALLHQLPLLTTKRLRGNILPVLWQETMSRTVIMCRCKFGSSNMEQMRGFLNDRELSSRFSQDADQVLEDQRQIWATKVTSRVWRRGEQVHDLRTELSLQALHAEDATQQQNQEYVGLHEHMTGLVQETQHSREMFEESRIAQSAAGPEIDRLRRREEELLEVRRLNNDRAKIEALSVRNRTDVESQRARLLG